MDIAKSYTHLYPAPFTFSQLHPPSRSSIHLHPAHFNLHSALSNTLSVIRIKNWMQLGNFPKLRPQNSNWSILTENLHTWYLEGANFKSGLRVLKFRPPKNIFWANLSRKSKKCLFCPKTDTHGISRMLIFIRTSLFWSFQHWLYFGQIRTKKIQSCPFCLKIGTQSISRMLILIPTLVFWNSKPKPRGFWFVFWH